LRGAELTLDSAFTGVPSAEPDVVEWIFDPWTERPLVAGIAALCLLGLWLLIASFRLPWLVALAQGVLVASPLLPAFVPAACRLEPGGAARRGVLGWMRRSWADVRRIEVIPVGVLLSPYTRRRWLDTTRALALPMPKPRRAELVALVHQRWSAYVG
jgi:hypothetical protein